MKLSVAMIVKNEELMIKECVDSVKDADEIVIVDTGSVDKTVEIAKTLTPFVYTDYKWNDSFCEARNHAISKCTGDWILTIDADDTLEPGGMTKIREAIAKYPDEFCLGVQYISKSDNSTHDIPVLYKRCKEVFWKGAIHNHLSQLATIHSSAIIYYGHSPSHKYDPDRTLRILEKEVEKNPTKPRELYYLAREYQYRKRWADCLHWCDKYLKIAIFVPEKADGYLMKAKALWNLQKGEEARDACLQAIKINTNFREALLFMAEMSWIVNREKWLWMAEIADNSQVLFIREKKEKPASYYEAIYKREENKPSRYTYLYEEVGRIIGKRSMLDIGCGQGRLSKYIENYDGFDIVQNPYHIGDIYTHDYGDYDVYVLLEVLEHLIRDIDVLEKIPAGKEVLFSVPSFDDPSHVRMFTENIVRWRYRELIKFTNITRFNFDDKHREWKITIPPTSTYILLCRGIKMPRTV